MGERILKEEMMYTQGLKIVMETLEQFRQYRYLEDAKKFLLSEAECGKTKIVCDLLDAVIETDKKDVVVREIEIRKTAVTGNFKKCVGNLLMLPSDIQKEFLHKEYYYNQVMAEDVSKQLGQFIQTETPFEAFDKMVEFMCAYGNQA